jgi:undecaprenyl-diphosphatase
MTYLGSSIAILFILTSLFLWHEHKRRWIVPLWVSLFFSGLFVVAIKLVSARVRPFYLGLPTLNIFINKFLWWDTSFPSFHAAIAFSALPVLDKEFPRFKFVWFAFACLVGFSRIYFALHFLSDVIAGAVLGYAVGILATRLEERYHYSEIVKMLIRKR